MTIRPCLGPLIAPASAKKKRKRHQTKKFSPVSSIRASLLPSQISDKQPQSCFSPLMQDGLCLPLLQPRQLRLVLLLLPFVAGQGGAWLLPRVTGQGEAQLLLPCTAGQGGALLLPHAAGWRGCFFLALPVREGEGRGCFLAPPARVAASSSRRRPAWLLLPHVAGQGGVRLLPRAVGQGGARLRLPRVASQGGARLLSQQASSCAKHLA
jgi:hypothetical protein